MVALVHRRSRPSPSQRLLGDHQQVDFRQLSSLAKHLDTLGKHLFRRAFRGCLGGHSAVDQVWGREFQGIWGRDHTWIDYYKPFRSCLSTVNQKLSDIHYIRGIHWNNIWIRPIYTAYGPTWFIVNGP